MEEGIFLTPLMAERKNNITQTIREYSSRLLGFIKQRVAVNEDAEDIMQEVLYQFAGNTAPIEQAGSWIFKVARNKIIDDYNRGKCGYTY